MNRTATPGIAIPGEQHDLAEDLVALPRRPGGCDIATSMAARSPQRTRTWVDTDGAHMIINDVQGFVKLNNIKRDPRLAVSISDPDNPSRYLQARGKVVDRTTQGGAEHIDMFSRKDTGGSHAWYGGRDQSRVIITIESVDLSGVG